MNGYVCFYQGKRVEVNAASTYQACCEAAKLLDVPRKKQHLISAVLTEKDGVQVKHTASF